MSKESEKAKADDPLDIKRSATGVLVVVIVCSFLWVISKFGPSAGNWLTQQLFTASAASIPKEKDNEAEPAEPGPTTTPAEIAPTTLDTNEAEVANPDPIPVDDSHPPATKSRIENAGEQILAALGGSEKAEVRHIAFSDDETSMVAAVQFLNAEKGAEMVEIYFDKDNFGRYISVSDSPVEKEIKIWDQP